MKSSTRSTVTSLLLSCFLLQQVVAAVSNTHNNNNKGDQWVSLSPRTSFLPATDAAAAGNTNSEQQLRRLKSSNNNNNGYANVLADGTYTKYDSYAQAWRLLGLYVDCESQVEYQERRRLEDEEEGGEENQEEDGEEENEEDGEEENEEDGEEGGDEEEVDEGYDEYANEYNMNRQCTRYMLWAAYVDEDYQGGGIGEYQYYNPETKKWDKSACQASGSQRCARMDCHLPNSHFKLLGFFKEANPVDFLGNLFNMQGSCQWDGDEYDFMTNQLAGLPEGCTSVSNNNNLYMDLKPHQGGTLDIGVYVDEDCAIEYRGSKSTAEILEEYYSNSGNNGGDNEEDEVNVTGNMSQFNQHLKDFQYCQPCRTFDLSNQGGYNNNGGRHLEDGEAEGDGEQEQEGENQEDDDDQQNEQEDNDEDGEDGEQDNQDQSNGNAFICQDYNGDQGMNQCSFFAQQGDMSKASLRDVAIASAQGGLTRTYVAVDVQERSWWARFGFLTISLLVFLVGLLMFCVLVKKKSRRILANKTEPLIQK